MNKEYNIFLDFKHYIECKNKTTKKIKRITIDLDTRDINQLIKCLKTLKKYKFNKDLQVKISPSGRGFHIISWADTKGVTLKKLIKIRRKAGDDKTRCDLDTWGSGQRMINVLFTGKKRKNLKKDEVIFNEQKMQVETMGFEESVKISYGET